jgi:phage shock protein C
MPKEELALPTTPAQDPTGEWKYDPYTGQKLN